MKEKRTIVTPEALFSTALTLLPVISEEEGLQLAISVESSESKFAAALHCSDREAASYRLIIQRMLSSLSLLDERALNDGEWRFVSFPACLLARHMLSTLAAPGQKLFSENYWQQGAHRPGAVVEEQRQLLQALESRRIRHHGEDTPVTPIRVVHVASALLRMDGRFLLLHREDRTRQAHGNYVLPGGRFSPTDWPSMQPANLAETQNTGLRLPLPILENTIRRELEEELGLLAKTHYSLEHWRDIAPWRHLEGARNHIAYTEYLITLFYLSLSEAGERHLHERLQKIDAAWFSSAALRQQVLPDGKRAFLDALLTDLGDSFVQTLDSVPESCLETRKKNESDAIDVPAGTGSLLFGKTGKEKSLDVALSTEERGLLFALAWHAKALPFAGLPKEMLLPRGWCQLPESLLLCVTQLAEKLDKAGYPVLVLAPEGQARLDIHPDQLFFAGELFRFRLHPESESAASQRWHLTLIADPVRTLLGTTDRFERTWNISRNAARIIEAIERGEDPEAQCNIKSGDIQKSLRDQVDIPLRACGIRKLARIVDGRYRLSIPREKNSGSSPLAQP